MLSTDVTQIDGLKRMLSRPPVQVIAVTGGKGGVGKSTISANLAISMAQAGRKVMLLDADLGLANLDVLLGLSPKHHLGHVIAGQVDLADVFIPGPAGIQLVPASNGLEEMAELSEAENIGLIRAFSELDSEVDTLIIDTAAGLGKSVINFARAAREVLLVVCDEPASITDAYATVKVLSSRYKVDRFHVVANRARTALAGRELFNKLVRVTDRFLDVHLEYLGTVPEDDQLQRAVQMQRAVVDAYPRSKSAQSIKTIARKVDAMPRPDGARGDLEFFVERLIQYSSADGMSVV